MKTLKTFTNLAEAGFAHSLLESAGLHPFLADEHTAGAYVPLTLQGIRLQVDEAEYEHAARVLSEWPDAEAPPPASEPEPPAEVAGDTRAAERIPVGIFIAAAVAFIVIAFGLWDQRHAQKRSVPSKRADYGPIERQRATETAKQATAQESTANFTNAAGELVQSRDENNDGKPDRYWFHRNGRLVRHEIDSNFDGRIDGWDFYGSDGMLERSETDDNFDGKPDGFTTYRNGRLVRQEIDSNFDGRINGWDFYGSDGMLERSEIDENYDGKPDRFTTYRNGLIAKVEADGDLDGKIDSWVSFGADGLREHSEGDVNEDGKPDEWYDYREGLCIAGRIDTDFNGVPDYFYTYRNGVLIQADIRPNDSPIVTRVKFYRNGQVREEWVDDDVDGKFDYRIEFDPFGKPSEHLPIPAQK